MGAGCHLAGVGSPWASRNLCQLGRATMQLPEVRPVRMVLQFRLSPEGRGLWLVRLPEFLPVSVNEVNRSFPPKQTHTHRALDRHNGDRAPCGTVTTQGQ